MVSSKPPETTIEMSQYRVVCLSLFRVDMPQVIMEFVFVFFLLLMLFTLLKLRPAESFSLGLSSCSWASRMSTSCSMRRTEELTSPAKMGPLVCLANSLAKLAAFSPLRICWGKAWITFRLSSLHPSLWYQIALEWVMEMPAVEEEGFLLPWLHKWCKKLCHFRGKCDL